MAAATRNEHDLLGDREVPAEAYWGIHTLRALENFPITGQAIGSYPDLVRALALREACRSARQSRSLGTLDERHAGAIVAACREIADGALDSEFVVDVIQGGAGTSTNMNANEVIANRGARAPRAPQRRIPAPASQQPRQHVAEHERRLSDRDPRRVCFAIARLLDAMAELRRSFEAQGERVRRRAQDGAHAAPGRGADDPRPGVQHFRGDDRRGRAAAARGRGADARDQPGRDRDRHRHQHRPALHRPGDAGTWLRSPGCRWCRPRTSSKRRRTPARSCSCRAC